jgi:Protein of unknown function (DUF2939)
MAAKGGLIVGGGALLLAGLAAGWWFGAPLYTVKSMEEALTARDANKLSQFVDYEALREDLRADVTATFNQRFGGADAGALGGAGLLAMAMVDPVVDQMISPEGMQAMMGVAQTGTAAAAMGGVSVSAAGKGEASPKFTLHRDGINTLRIKPEGHEDAFALVFSRRGLGWKLTGVDIGAGGSVGK